tara:strand:- start:309 stop:410 length:102 start_codon:yes stop_codon:yes gene_type:complete
MKIINVHRENKRNPTDILVMSSILLSDEKYFSM